MNFRVPLLFSSVALAPWCVHGLGIRIADQDAQATARGNAFAATADNPAAIYYNPAGITRLEGQQAEVGAYTIWLNSQYADAKGVEVNTRDRIQAVPQVYYTYSPEAVPLSFGLGLYSPYGLSLEWPDSAPFSDVGTRGQILYVTLNPVVAWRINPSLSIAAGPTINYGDAELRSILPPPAAGPVPARFRFRGDDIDGGFNAGLLWKPHPRHSFGLTYRSQSTLDFGGHSSIESPLVSASSVANARFPFPQSVAAGWSYRSTPNWNLEFDVDWTDWSRLKTVTLQQPALGDKALAFNWRSSFFYEWGATRSFENGFRLSAGYIFSENTVPDKDFTPLVPDSDRHIFSVGLGRTHQRLRWDAGYQFAYGPPRTVTSATHPSANGTYRFLSHAFAVSIGYSF